MFYNPKFIKIISIALCICIFLSIGTNVKAETKNLSDDSKWYGKLVSQLTSVLLSLGDGVFHLMSKAVGEPITIDKLVFNEVGKVSIDYWDDTDSDDSEKQIKAFMEPVVTKWYKVFYQIAIVVYMIILVYIGVRILLTVASPEKKAGYKEMFTSWVIGVTILFMFPYVMKYIVIINNAVVKTLDQKAEGTGSSTSKIAEMDYFDVSGKYGTSDFIEYIGNPDTEIIALTRKAADCGTTSTEIDVATGDRVKTKEGDIALALVYLMLLGQTLAILVMYYNRTFMIAFLITIFPLVAMTYAIDKIGDGKNQSFNIWFKEFIVNVIIQMFHAVIYLLVTGAGIKSYLSSGGQNFLFMFLSVLFLFEGEKILRAIFDINSKAGTMSDLAQSGALAFATIKGIGSLKKGGNDIGSAGDKSDVSAATNRMNAKKNLAKETNDAALAALDKKAEKGESLDSHGEYQGKDREPEGLSTPKYDEQNAKDTVLVKAMKRRLKSGILVGTVNKVASFAGGTLEMTKNMAAGKTSAGDMITSYMAGREMGKTLATPVTFAIGKGEQVIHAARTGKSIKKGEMDKDLGLANLPDTSPVTASDVDSSKVEEKMDSQQQIYREALAAYARLSAIGGKNAGEIAYYKYLEKNLKK
jgi:hypothetical protein